MCVPVRSRSSRRNSSSSMRGSMLRSYSMPFTRTRTESLSLTSPGALLDRLFLVAAASGINMSYLDLFTSGSTSGNSEGTFYERGNQRSLVISRATHIGLWIGRSACCLRGFSNGSADRTAIAYLHVGDSGGAIVNDWNLRCHSRIFDFRMPRQRTEMQRLSILLDVRSPRDEREVDQMLRIRESQLHKRDQALPSRQKFGLVA